MDKIINYKWRFKGRGGVLNDFVPLFGGVVLKVS
jgi:hypothetical protein